LSSSALLIAHSVIVAVTLNRRPLHENRKFPPKGRFHGAVLASEGQFH
jgi:hypothetical protein